MAEQDNIQASQAPMEDDTRTRRTVRLKTIVPAATGPSIDNASISENAVAKAMEDTRTRMTVKLKPAAAAVPAIEPAASSVQDNVAEDTRTRMTVKLKPAAPVAPVIPASPAVPATPVAAEKDDMVEDTRTRVTVKLKPAAPTPAPSIAPAAPVPAKAPESAAEEDDTRTRRNTIIAPGNKGTAEEDDTRTRRNTIIAPGNKGTAEDDDRTVRIVRPSLKKPLPVPAAASSLEKNAAADIPKPLNPVNAVPPASAPASAPVSPAVIAPQDIISAANSAKPSLFYMIVSLVALIFLLGTAALTTVHYLNFQHNVDVEIPGIPFEK